MAKRANTNLRCQRLPHTYLAERATQSGAVSKGYRSTAKATLA